MAGRDVRAAHACLNAREAIPEVAAYLCQQATEKLLKGLLVLAGVPFSKTHDLQPLRDLAVSRFPDLHSLIDRLVPLTPWAHTYRYPNMGGDPAPSVEELHGILDAIGQFAARVASLNDPSRED